MDESEDIAMNDAKDEVEELAELLAGERDAHPRKADDMDSEELAAAILTSGWIAKRDLRIRAEALEVAAAEIEEVARIEMKNYKDITTEEHFVYAEYFGAHQGRGRLARAAWLRRRAEDLRKKIT